MFVPQAGRSPIQRAQAQPGKLNYASSGPGTPYHMAAELFKSMAKIDMVHKKWSLCDAINGMPGVTQLTDDTMVVPETSARLQNADVARPWFPSD